MEYERHYSLEELTNKYCEDENITALGIFYGDIENPFPVGAQNVYKVARGRTVSDEIRYKMACFLEGIEP